LHRKVVSKFCENALMLIMNALSTEAQDKIRLPLFIYEVKQAETDLEK